MPKTKGTDTVSLKSFFTKENKDMESKFLAKLSEDDQKVYQSTIATSWIDVNAVARILEAAGSTLFPGEKDALVQLGIKLGEKAYSGIYSVFLLIPKPSYVLKRAANVWKSYYDKGVANIENTSEKGVDLIVRGFPDLPKALRDSTSGHISVLLGKTGLKSLNITHNETNPDQWIWHTTWN